MSQFSRPRSLSHVPSPFPVGVDAATVWQAFVAASEGDVPRLRALVGREPRVAGLTIENTTALHLAVREGQEGAVHVLLDAGADVGVPTVFGDALVEVARMRGHRRVQRILQRVVANAPDPPPGATGTAEFEPVDLALWTGPFWTLADDVGTAQRLAGPSPDLVISAALGDMPRVADLIKSGDVAPDTPRPTGKRALSAAIQYEQDVVAHFLLDHGADPTAPEGPMAPRGSALYAAARRGDGRLVTHLLSRGADPNAGIQGLGSATYAASDPTIRAQLLRAGGVLTPFERAWVGDDEGVVRQLEDDPASAHSGCGSVFAALCALGRRDLLTRALAIGARPPHRADGCRRYLLDHPDMLATLLDAGLDPNLPNWQESTLLHLCCSRDRRDRPHPNRLECAAQLLDAGAALEARDLALCSRPLAWAARDGLADMVALLLSRGAQPTHIHDPAWASPAAWAARGGFVSIVRQLGST